jgi:hypothetical protein
VTTEGFLGSSPVAVLDKLTATMGIEHKLGTAEEARLGAPPRITWVPPEKGGIGTERAPFALPDRDVTELQTQAFDVHIFAASYTDLLAMHAGVAAQLDVLIGPKTGQLPTLALDGVARPGYAFGQPANVGPVQRAEVAGSWACTVPATLKDFVARATYTTAPIHAPAPVTVTTTALDGTTEQQALP